MIFFNELVHSFCDWIISKFISFSSNDLNASEYWHEQFNFEIRNSTFKEFRRYGINYPTAVSIKHFNSRLNDEELSKIIDEHFLWCVLAVCISDFSLAICAYCFLFLLELCALFFLHSIINFDSDWFFILSCI